METVVFNTNSWHFKLASKVGYKYWRGNLDLCSYIRWVVWGMVVVIGAVSLASLAAYAVADAVAWWAAMLFNWKFMEASTFAGVATFLIVVVCLMFAGVDIDVAPSFVSEAYKSFKTKTCRRVSFK